MSRNNRRRPHSRRIALVGPLNSSASRARLYDTGVSEVVITHSMGPSFSGMLSIAGSKSAYPVNASRALVCGDGVDPTTRSAINGRSTHAEADSCSSIPHGPRVQRLGDCAASRGLATNASHIPGPPSRRWGVLISTEVGAGASEKINGSISLYSAHVLGLRKSRPSNGIPGNSVSILSRGICLANVSGDTLYCGRVISSPRLVCPKR
jgi:hypothetical protein